MVGVPPTSNNTNNNSTSAPPTKPNKTILLPSNKYDGLPTAKEADEALEHFHTYSQSLQKQQQQQQQNQSSNGPIPTTTTPPQPPSSNTLPELKVEPWRHLIVRTLSYTSNGTHNKTKSETTVSFLVSALDRYYQRQKTIIAENTTDGDDGGDATASSCTTRVSPESVLVDALWLHGSNLEPAPPDPAAKKTNVKSTATAAAAAKTTTTAAAAKTTAAIDGYRSLCDIIHGLVYGTHSESYNNRRTGLIELLQTSLESTLLAHSGVVANNSPKGYIQRLRKILTNMYYRQKKVNLLQEESEGYAKLLTFLVALPCMDDGGVVVGRVDGDSGRDSPAAAAAEGGGGGGDGNTPARDHDGDVQMNETHPPNEQPPPPPSSPPSTPTTERVRELIGAFDLDPNRVLDLALDILESQISLALEPSRQSASSSYSNHHGPWQIARHAPDVAVTVWSLLEIVGMFTRENVSHLVGFKISSYRRANIMAVVHGGAGGSGKGKDVAVPVAAPAAKPNGGSENTPASNKQQKDQKDKKKERGPRTTDGINPKPTPPSLYLTTAILASHSLLSLPSLLPHLRDDEYDIITFETTTKTAIDDVLESYELWRKEFIAVVKKTGVINLNPGTSTSNKDKEEGGSGGRTGGDTKRKMEAACETNQLIQLLRMLVEVGLDWRDVTGLFRINTNDIGDHGQDNNNDDDDRDYEEEELAEKAMTACCSIYPPLGRSLCSYVFSLIERIYKARVEEIGTKLCRRPVPPPPPAQSTKSATVIGEDNDEETDYGSFSLLPDRLIDGPSSSYSYRHYSSAPPEFLAIGSTAPGDITLLQLSQILTGPLVPMVETGSIAFEPVVYCKLCRLVRVLLLDHIHATKTSITSEGGEGNSGNDGLILEESIVDLFQRFLIPSLSLFPHNLAISDELWLVVSLLPYHIRYVLYDSWRGPGLEKAALRALTNNSSVTPYSENNKPLLQIRSEVDTWFETRWLLRRMSRDNIREMGRQIAKVSHNNPLVLFSLILAHIESYDNFIGMVVDIFKYVGGLGLDVLGYCLLGSLGGLRIGGDCEGATPTTTSKKPKVKEDGVSKPQWFTTLETFTGIFYKKFPDVNLHGLLSYLLRRLKGGHVDELGIFQSLLKEAGGYAFAYCVSTANLSPMQLEGRCGTRLLKRETNDFGIVTKVNEKASRRLRQLLHEDGFGIAYLVLLSQLRAQVLFGEEEKSSYGGMAGKKEIKVIGSLNDCCRQTMHILQACMEDFAADNQSGNNNTAQKQAAVVAEGGEALIQKYAKSFPSLEQLHKDFGVDTATAWMLSRALVRCAVRASSSSLSSPPSSESYLERFDPSSESMQSTYPSMLPSICWSYLTPLLFSRFYSLCIYDIYCPTECYETKIKILKREVGRLTQLQRGSGKDAQRTRSLLAASVAAAGGTEQQIRDAGTFTKTHELDLERSKCHSEELERDLRTQKEHCRTVLSKLEKERDLFLAGIEGTEHQLSTASYFLTYCVYPRCILSPDDALYCCRFVKELHRMETKGFFTLQFFDCVVNAVIGSVYCVTEDEAANLGILLEETWELLSLWRYNSEEYDKAVANKPGATWLKLTDIDTTTGTGNLTTANIATSSSLPPTTTITTTRKEAILHSISHSEFTTLYNRWHAQLGSTFIGGLQSSEYMHTRISLILLTRIVRHFPTKSKLGDKFDTVLEPLQSDENPMPDIKLMAQAYKSLLSKIKWKEEDVKVTEAKLEKEREEKKRKMEMAEKRNEGMNKEVASYDRQIQQPRVRWTNPPNPLRSSDPRPRTQNNLERKDDPLATRWEQKGSTNAAINTVNNSNGTIPTTGANIKKRTRSPDRSTNDHGSSDPKRSRPTRQPNVPADPRDSKRTSVRRSRRQG